MTTDTCIERREFGTLRLRGRIWWLRYRVNGREHEESSHTTSRREAEKLLARRQAELAVGQLTAPDAKRVTFTDLAQMIRDDYKVRGRRSLVTLGRESREPRGVLWRVPRARNHQRPGSDLMSGSASRQEWPGRRSTKNWPHSAGVQPSREGEPAPCHRAPIHLDTGPTQRQDGVLRGVGFPRRGGGAAEAAPPCPAVRLLDRLASAG